MSNPLRIINTSFEDWPKILWLFEQTNQLQQKPGYRVWQSMDEATLAKDIQNRLQYKIIKGEEIVCLFSIQLNDPLIWREKDQDDAVYLHRIVVHPQFRGRQLFKEVLDWAKHFAQRMELKFIRMDTWADNSQLIAYYRSFGFQFIENYRTSYDLELPLQNRNLEVALLEMGF